MTIRTNLGEIAINIIPIIILLYLRYSNETVSWCRNIFRKSLKFLHVKKKNVNKIGRANLLLLKIIVLLTRDII